MFCRKYFYSLEIPKKGLNKASGVWKTRSFFSKPETFLNEIKEQYAATFSVDITDVKIRAFNRR